MGLSSGVSWSLISSLGYGLCRQRAAALRKYHRIAASYMYRQVLIVPNISILHDITTSSFNHHISLVAAENHENASLNATYSSHRYLCITKR